MCVFSFVCADHDGVLGACGLPIRGAGIEGVRGAERGDVGGALAPRRRTPPQILHGLACDAPMMTLMIDSAGHGRAPAWLRVSWSMLKLLTG